MGEVEEAQEQMKADMKALKEQMATMMEAMMSIKEIMEVNVAAIAATSTIAEVDLTSPIWLQPNKSSNLRYGRSRRQRVGRYRRPSFSAKNKHVFPPYGLLPNYAPPNVAYTPSEDVDNSVPILF